MAQHRTGYVISDLHIGAAYSLGDKHWPAIKAAAQKSNFFVINGDFMEMYYRYDDFDARLTHALVKTLELIRSNPACEFHYILGNHENIHVYEAALKNLANQPGISNLHVHEHYYRTNNALFIHGDGPLHGEEIEEKRIMHSPEHADNAVRRAMARGLNTFQSPIRRARFGACFSNGRDIGQILNALDISSPLVRDNIRYVFYAHTHHPKFDAKDPYSNIKFYNTGAATQGAEFNMLRVEMDKENVINVGQCADTLCVPEHVISGGCAIMRK